MESITIGQVAVAVTFLVGLISGIAYLNSHLKAWLNKSLQEEFNALKTEIQGLKQEIKRADIESCKNYLVQVLSDIDRGVKIDETERQRFYEQYEHYCNAGGNSYIHEKVERLKANNKL